MTLSPETQEVVAAFNGVVPYSRYSNDFLLSRKLRIHHTNKYGAPLVMGSMIMWPYTEFCTGATTKNATAPLFIKANHIPPHQGEERCRSAVSPPLHERLSKRPLQLPGASFPNKWLPKRKMTTFMLATPLSNKKRITWAPNLIADKTSKSWEAMLILPSLGRPANVIMASPLCEEIPWCTPI